MPNTGLNTMNLMQSFKSILKHQGIEEVGRNAKVGLDYLAGTKYLEFDVPKEDYAYGRKIIHAMLYENINDADQLMKRIKSIPVPEHIVQRQMDKTLGDKNAKGFVDETTGKKHFLNPSTGSIVTVDPDGKRSLQTYDSPKQGASSFGQLIDGAGKTTGKMPRIVEGGAEALSKAIEHSASLLGKIQNVAGDAFKFLGKASKVLVPVAAAAAIGEVTGLNDKIASAIKLGLVPEAAAAEYDQLLAGHLAQATADPTIIGGELATQTWFDDWAEKHKLPEYVKKDLAPSSIYKELQSFFESTPNKEAGMATRQDIEWSNKHQQALELFAPAKGEAANNSPGQNALLMKKGEFAKNVLTEKQQEFLAKIEDPQTAAFQRSEHIDKLARSLSPEQAQAMEKLHQEQQALTGKKPEVKVAETKPEEVKKEGVEQKAKVDEPPKAEPPAAEKQAAEPTAPEIKTNEKGRVTATFNANADPQPSGPRPAMIRSGNAVAKYDAQVLEAQKLMKERGIDAGPLDGKEGPLTRAGIEKYAQETGKDPKTMTLAGMIEDMKANPKKPEAVVKADPVADKPAVVAQAENDPKIDQWAKEVFDPSHGSEKKPEAASPAATGGVVFTRQDIRSGKDIVAGSADPTPATQTMTFDEKADRLVITDAKGTTPRSMFGSAASGETPEPQTPEIAPDLLNTAKVTTQSGMRFGG